MKIITIYTYFLDSNNNNRNVGPLVSSRLPAADESLTKINHPKLYHVFLINYFKSFV